MKAPLTVGVTKEVVLLMEQISSKKEHELSIWGTLDTRFTHQFTQL